jgi:hypothetical protein
LGLRSTRKVLANRSKGEASKPRGKRGSAQRQSILQQAEPLYIGKLRPLTPHSGINDSGVLCFRY